MPPPTAPRSLGRPPGARARHAVLALSGVAWAATVFAVVRAELADSPSSSDVRALVEAARLDQRHASAAYAIRLGGTEVGRLESSVSGGQSDEQLAYVLRANLDRPQRVDVRGFLIADWDRRPQRFVLELDWVGLRHRLDGGIRPDPSGGALFHARWVPPSGPDRTLEWTLPEAPVLAAGPLPLPDFGGGAPAGEGATFREGVTIDPVSGEPRSWRVATEPAAPIDVAGTTRLAVKHRLDYGPITVTAWVEPSGFPLRVELPLGLTVELVEETR